MPFTALPQDEPIGLEASIWRFSSSLTKDSSGQIEICYVEKGGPKKILGVVPVRPFVSSESKMPDLRILVARDMSSSERKVIVIVGYGIRSGVFVQDIPGMTSHSLFSDGNPKADSKGEITLTGFTQGGGSTMELDGRLFFRYVSAAQ